MPTMPVVPDHHDLLLAVKGNRKRSSGLATHERCICEASVSP
jgi:hypothetical protein